MDILLTGSVAFDCLMTFPGLFREQILPEKLQSLSLSFLVDTMARHRGGIAANIAYTLALLGNRPRIMATVGKDFGEYRQALEQVGVDMTLIKEIPDVYTGAFFVTTDKADCQIASFYPGAMAHAAELSLRDVSPAPDLVVVSPDDPAAMRQHVRESRELGFSLLYDPSQQVARIAGAEIIEGIDACRILMCNEYEFDLICNKTGRTAKQLEEKVPVLIVTLGEKGSRIRADGREYAIPIVPPRRLADPTGVGDAFRGGLLTGFAHGLSWEACGRMGALAATYCLEEVGTQNHFFTKADFYTRYQSAFGANTQVEHILA
jgi:adenosine kinase